MSDVDPDLRCYCQRMDNADLTLRKICFVKVTKQ